MAKSCSIFAHCINSKGEEVESRLFKDLLQYTSNNRELTKEYYGIGINPTFLNSVLDKAEFDENGEIIFQSLRKLAKLNIQTDSLLNILNKEIKSGNYEYDEAITRLQSFNRNSQFKEDFMATISSSKGGKYFLSIVPRTTSNEASLNKTISNRSLLDRIKYYLNKAGVGIEFIEEDEKINGRYSTQNAEKTADGLYNLILVASGKKVTGTLAEEAGHFAVGALGDSPLVKRLLNLLTPEVLKLILGEASDKYLGSSSLREVAGTLVGKAIEGEIDKKTPWGTLSLRIVDLAKRIFYTLKGDDISLAKLNAKRTAELIAQGFMSPNFTGNIEEALKTKETLYNASLSTNVKTFKKIATTLNIQAKEMRSISASLFDKFNRIAGLVEGGRIVNKPSIFSDAIALEGITEALVLLSDLLIDEIPSTLESIDFSDATDFSNNMVRNAKALRMVRTFTKNAVSILETINFNLSGIADATGIVGDITRVSIIDSSGNTVVYNLKELSSKINLLLLGDNGILYTLKNKEAQFFLRFLEEANYGRNYIIRACRVVFNWKNRGDNKLILFKLLEKIPLSDILNSLENDISYFERYLSSMSNSSDVIGQLVDRVTKLANKQADDLSNLDLDRLRVLLAKLKKIGLSNTDIFVERSNTDGTITGNIVSKYCWGDYERDWLEFKRKCIEDFNSLYPDLSDKSDNEKALLWQSFFNPKVKVWHRGDAFIQGHSLWDAVLQMWIPNDTYESILYRRGILPYPERVKWLNEYMELKASIDSRLPEGSMPLHRMPLFKGTFSNKVRNRKLFESASKSTIHTVMTSIRDTFLEDSEDTDFGSLLTYNTIEEDMFGNQLAFESEKINRIPLYGINKLKDPSELSTDLFYSTFAYAGMANSYAAMSLVVDTLEVGTEILNKRSVGGIKNEQETKIKSRAYERYLKFLDKLIYGIGVPKLVLGRRLVVNKISGFLTNLASKLYLGGNVPGGIVNLGTGTLEVFKEAFTGEHFNLKDWTVANKLYLQSFVLNWLSYGKDIKQDKVSLMIRHFNMLGENRTKQKDWHTRDTRILNMFGESLFLPYKAGEHYMTVIPYLALSLKIKLYDSNGNKISLFNAYKVEDIEDSSGNIDKNYGKTLKLDGIFFKDKANILEYNIIQSIINKINTSINNRGSLLGSSINLTLEELDYINNNNYNLANLEETKTKLEQVVSKFLWTVDDESSFMDKAREINNRLHGIYNNLDKVAALQNILGNMILAMRGYALGQIERRFGASKYSVSLGGESEGSVRTVAKLLLYGVANKKEIGFVTRALLLPVTSKVKQDMLQAGFSANQYYNLRRNLADFMIIASLILIVMATSKGGDDEDDDEEGDTILGIAYYFTSRLLRELEALTTIRGLSEEIPNLTNLSPIGISALYDISNFVYMLGGSFVADEDNSKIFYQSSKEGIYEEGDPKWETKFWKMFPYLRSNYVLQHPYEAAKSFEYGLKVKN